MTISKKIIKAKIRRQKQLRKHAVRTQRIGNVAATLIPGDTFKYKDYSCEVAYVTNGLVYFSAIHKSPYSEKKGMILNIESFNAGVAEHRIVMTRPQDIQNQENKQSEVSSA